MNGILGRRPRFRLMGQFKASIHGKTVPYTLKRSYRARLVWLRIGPLTGLSVTVPASYDIARLPEYLELKWEWIERNLIKCHEDAVPRRENILQKENLIPYLGKFLEVIQKKADLSLSGVELNGDHLVVNVNAGDLGGLNAQIERWYRAQADCLIRWKVLMMSTTMGLTYNNVGIRSQRTRWGSCSCKKNLSFNWRIIMAPEPVIDYVVVHELSHLKQMNHSKKFWKIVAGHCPKWHECRKWLNAHGPDMNSVLPLRTAGPLPA
jgi:predicted metal-dependent hydrolase